jgi:hypothetical protein
MKGNSVEDRSDFLTLTLSQQFLQLLLVDCQLEIQGASQQRGPGQEVTTPSPPQKAGSGSPQGLNLKL